MVASTVHPRCHPCLLTPSRPSDSGGRSQRAEPHGPPPTSVHAYKSRQSRIPGGGLSRWSWAAVGWPKRAPQGDRATQPIEPLDREWRDERIAREGQRRGLLQSRDPTCKWCAFIVSKERRMNMWSGKRNKTEKRRAAGYMCVWKRGVRSVGLNENGNDRNKLIARRSGDVYRIGRVKKARKVERRLTTDAVDANNSCRESVSFELFLSVFLFRFSSWDSVWVFEKFEH